MLSNSYNKNKCQPYILLTTQRSGSTWVCSILNDNNDDNNAALGGNSSRISCGSGTRKDGNTGTKVSELMIGYWHRFMKDPANITWSQYQRSFENAMLDALLAQGDACRNRSVESEDDNEPATATAAFGFKLMYDQIPAQFIKNGLFVRFLREQGIAVVHLVREAAALKFASQRQTLPKQMHSTNSTEAEQFRSMANPIQWNAGFIEQIHRLEQQHTNWRKRLQWSLSSWRYHYIAYEMLLMPEDRDRQLHQLFNFLLPKSTRTTTMPQQSTRTTRTAQSAASTSQTSSSSSVLQILHEPSCSERIKNYAVFRKKIKGTRTAVACDRLEAMFGRNA